MAVVAKMYLLLDCHLQSGQTPPTRLSSRRGCPMWDQVCVKGRRRVWVMPCRSFLSENGAGVKEKHEKSEENFGKLQESSSFGSRKIMNKLVNAIRNAVWRVSKPGLLSKSREELVKLEEKLFSLSIHIGGYIATMLSTGVILLTRFQLSGGDDQMNALIWYSWLGGIVIGTMIGYNMVLEEVSRCGPRNVVITGSTRGLGKALAREFLLSGGRVVVCSRSPESVNETVKELAENLNQVMIATGFSSRKQLRHAKVVGIPCEVSNPEDTKKLANFAASELWFR